MKHISEYRDPKRVAQLTQAIRATMTRPWTLMEICGGQTHTIARFGLEELLPETLRLAHGPGCPVCVTPISLIDKAIQIADTPGTILCSFGDMLRVPGSRDDLFSARSRGGDVRVVYSPLDALALAERQPDKQVVFFAVGFETTAPANAMAVFQAAARHVSNFSILVSHALVPPAMEMLLASPDCRINAFMAAGHVCAIVGESEYHAIAKRWGVPIVVTGFEPIDILQGALMCVRQLESGRAVVENQYTRVVQPEGNKAAMQLIRLVFTVTDRVWRGIGVIPKSGYVLSKRFRDFDAEKRFQLYDNGALDSTECISGRILQGSCAPTSCPAFGTRCTPERPLGAPMVSSEGACAAYYKYRRLETTP